MIYYVTIAYGEKYRAISLDLVTSFLQYSSVDSILQVITDDCSYYDSYETKRLQVYQGMECSGIFKANLKFQAFEHVPRDASIVIFLDCDCFLRGEIKDEWYNDLDYGLWVPLGHSPSLVDASVLDNPTIRHKMQVLMQLYGVTKIPMFVERCFIIKPLISADGPLFLDTWKCLYDTVEELQLTHCGEFVEISIAASHLKVNSTFASPLEAVLYTRERTGVEYSALR